MTPSCTGALEIARELGYQDLVHRSVYNLSAIQLELGEPKAAEKGLRRFAEVDTERVIDYLDQVRMRNQ